MSNDAAFSGWLTSFAVFVLASMANESADSSWSGALGLTSQDILTPSALLSVGEIVSSFYAPLPISRGLLAGGSVGLLLQLKRWQQTTEIFPLILIGLIIVLGVVYQNYLTRSAFSDFY